MRFLLVEDNLDKALSDPDTAKLLEQLLETGCIYVE